MTGHSTVKLAAQPMICGRRWFRVIDRVILPVGLLLLLNVTLIARSKDDVVVLKNGDRMTGEIKKVQFGTLFFKPAYALESIQIDWTEVEQLESRSRFNVGLTSGAVHTGLIRKASASEDVTISDAGATVRVLRTEVFRILPLNNNLWRQMTGSVDYGFTFASDNNEAQSSLGARANYVGESNGFALTLSSSVNTRSNGPGSSRHSFGSDYTRRFSEKWYATLLAGLLRSSQQELNLRSTAGGGIGRILIRTDRTKASAFAGLVFSREEYSTEAGMEPRTTGAEGVLGLDFVHFRFDLVDLNSRLLVYPSITTSGRVRVNSESSISWKFVKDFYWSLRIYEDYDSRPPIIAPKNDFGVTTSIGWKF